MEGNPTCASCFAPCSPASAHVPAPSKIRVSPLQKHPRPGRPTHRCASFSSKSPSPSPTVTLHGACCTMRCRRGSSELCTASSPPCRALLLRVQSLCSPPTSTNGTCSLRARAPTASPSAAISAYRGWSHPPPRFLMSYLFFFFI
jgi:hypothetical protein